MKIKSEKFGEGKNVSTTLSWEFEGRIITLEFSTIARAVYSSVTRRVYVSEYIKSLIYVYSRDGILVNTYKIPKNPGYQFRGLNKNDKSETGVSLLYVPVESGKGNEWGDIEQYEFLNADVPLGKFIDIYR